MRRTRIALAVLGLSLVIAPTGAQPATSSHFTGDEVIDLLADPSNLFFLEGLSPILAIQGGNEPVTGSFLTGDALNRLLARELSRGFKLR
jgi:hypothetical protein